MSSGDQSEPSQQKTDGSPVFPLSLKIVATSFLILGIFGIVDFILSALSGHVSIDLRILALFIGRGLWRLSARAHWWALFSLKVILPAMIVALALGSFFADTMKECGALLLLALLCCFMFWQLRVLMRSDIQQLVLDSELKARLIGTTRGRYQFTLASLFVVMLVVGLVATRVGAPPLLWENGGDVTDDDYQDVLSLGNGYVGEDRPWYIRYDTAWATSRARGRTVSYKVGYREPRWGRKQKELLYVVFACSDGTFGFPVHSWMRSGGARGVTLSKPDGTEVELPEEGRQLYEFIDGKYRESDQRVSIGQFVEFIRSKPAEYTIDALLDFAQAHPDDE